MCLFFEPHSNSHLCLSSFCSSVCTFADVVGRVNRRQLRKGRGSSRSCCHGCPGKSLGEGSASVFLARQLCGAGTQSGNISAHSALWLSMFRRTSWKSRQRAFGQFCWRRGRRLDFKKMGFSPAASSEDILPICLPELHVQHDNVCAGTCIQFRLASGMVRAGHISVKEE